MLIFIHQVGRNKKPDKCNDLSATDHDRSRRRCFRSRLFPRFYCRDHSHANLRKIVSSRWPLACVITMCNLQFRMGVCCWVPENLTLFQTRDAAFCYPVPDKIMKIDTVPDWKMWDAVDLIIGKRRVWVNVQRDPSGNSNNVRLYRDSGSKILTRPCSRVGMAKSIPCSRQKRWFVDPVPDSERQKPYPVERPIPYSPYMGVPSPPPPPWGVIAVCRWGNQLFHFTRSGRLNEHFKISRACRIYGCVQATNVRPTTWETVLVSPKCEAWCWTTCTLFGLPSGLYGSCVTSAPWNRQSADRR